MAASGTHRGFFRDIANSRLGIYYNGTEAVQVVAAGVTVPGTLEVTGVATLTAAAVLSAGATVTTGGFTVTAGNLVVTAGDVRNTAGNDRLGTVSAFATTQPVSATVWKAGTAPSGAITTSGGIYTDGTTIKKIIADGTISDVQT